MSSVYSKEQAIFHAQQLEVIYSLSGTLHKIFPNALRSMIDIAKPKLMVMVLLDLLMQML